MYIYDPKRYKYYGLLLIEDIVDQLYPPHSV